ncbi:MAG: hypothetical protein WAM97_15500, partial [Acidimicrobiales bacterium]
MTNSEQSSWVSKWVVKEEIAGGGQRPREEREVLYMVPESGGGSEFFGSTDQPETPRETDQSHTTPEAWTGANAGSGIEASATVPTVEPQPGPEWAPPSTAKLPSTPKKTLWWVASAAVLVIALVVGLVAAFSGNGNGKSTADSGLGGGQSQLLAFVQQGATKTMAERTADGQISGNIAVDGQSIPIYGTGEFDFQSGVTSATMSYKVSGESYDMTELYSGGNMYMSINVNGQNLSRLTGGKQWIALPLADSMQGSSSFNISSLKFIAGNGSKVTSLGKSTIDGVSVTGYAVTPSAAAEIKSIKAEEAKLGDSSADAVFNSEEKNPPVITEKVWFDSSGLLRQMDMNLGLSSVLNRAAGSGSGSVVMTLD